MGKWKILITSFDSFEWIMHCCSQYITAQHRESYGIFTDAVVTEKENNKQKHKLSDIISQNTQKTLTLKLKWIVCRRHLLGFALSKEVRLSGTYRQVNVNIALWQQLNLRKLQRKDRNITYFCIASSHNYSFPYVGFTRCKLWAIQQKRNNVIS